jgi:peptidoglycan hydrolase CwlO-like protein
MTEKELIELLKESAKNRANEISDILNKISDTHTKCALVENHKKTLAEIMELNEKLKTLN